MTGPFQGTFSILCPVTAASLPPYATHPPPKCVHTDVPDGASDTLLLEPWPMASEPSVGFLVGLRVSK